MDLIVSVPEFTYLLLYISLPDLMVSFASSVNINLLFSPICMPLHCINCIILWPEINQSAKGTEMTDSIRNSSKKKKKKKKKKKRRRKKILICIKPLQEEHLMTLWTGLSER